MKKGETRNFNSFKQGILLFQFETLLVYTCLFQRTCQLSPSVLPPPSLTPTAMQKWPPQRSIQQHRQETQEGGQTW